MTAAAPRRVGRGAGRGRDLALLDRGRRWAAEAKAVDDDAFAALLARWGGAERPEDLTVAGFRRALDHLTVIGFRDRAWPIVSPDYVALLKRAARELRLSEAAYRAVLREEGGAADERDLSGSCFIRMMVRFDRLGFPFAAVKRSVMSERQIKLLAVARKRLRYADERYYTILGQFGCVDTATNLDARGFDLVMAFVEAEGFEPFNRKAPAPAAPADPAFGARPGFASAEQLGLIRALWREWSGGDDEAALARWIERTFKVSALRFLTADAARGAIAGLKAMKARRRPPTPPPAQAS